MESGDRLAERLGRWPLAGLAVSLTVLATSWYQNVTRLEAGHALPTIGVVLLLGFIATALLRILTGGWARAGLTSGILAVWLFYAAPLSMIAGSSALAELGLLLALGAIGIFLARKVPPESRARLINGKMNVILVPASLGMAAATLHAYWQLERQRPDQAAYFPKFEGRADAHSPDVWHILFDRYASAETLRDRYQFDNRPFLAELGKRGFQVGEGRFSNYQRTAHSVAATLNGAELDGMAGAMQASQSDWVPIYRSISHNRAARFFRDAGYRTVLAGSWWAPTAEFPGAQTIHYRPMPEFARLMLTKSAAGTILRWLGLPYGDPRADQCRRARHKFERLRALAGDRSRKYVFAHFLVPHPPFVLNADGSCRDVKVALSASRRDNYVNQIQFANNGVLALVDAILAGPRPAVIVIHSDEGPWPEPHVGDEHRLGQDPVEVDWAAMNSADLKEKMGILIAVRAPDGPPATMPETPVAIYPALLRDHFGSARPLPPVRHRIFAGDDALYRFQDVAAKLK